MKTKSVLKKLGLNQQGFDKIKDAVKNAESKTSGEIAVALAPESSDYSIWELSAALITSALCFCLLLPFAGVVRNYFEDFNMVVTEWYLPATYGIAIFIAVLVFFFVFNIPVLDRLVIPAAFMKKTVSDKAFSIFAETGVYCTERHNGILIYVSYLERQVRIIADKGISGKISGNLWQLIADDLAAELKKGNGVDAFCSSIEKCGDLLSEFFPIEKDDVNELSDGLLIVEN